MSEGEDSPTGEGAGAVLAGAGASFETAGALAEEFWNANCTPVS